MSMGKVLLLIGSPKKSQSTSESLGSYLTRKLAEKGFKTETISIHQSVTSDSRRNEFLAAVDKANIIILAFPLYVDSLPYLVIRALELIAQYRQTGSKMLAQRFLCIVNCGFPEAHHNKTAIAICRKFADEVGFDWAGGLALGGGEAIGGKPVNQVGFIGRCVKKALDLTAEALAIGNQVPEEAVALMAKPMMPRWLYLLIATISLKHDAKKRQVHKNLGDRPYA